MKALIFALLFSQPAMAQTAPAANPAVPVAAPAPTGAVKVKVLTKGKGLPIGKAELRVTGGEPVFTAPDGSATLTLPPSGEGKVTVTRKGYEPGEVAFSELRLPGEYEIYLYPGVDDENTIIVRGTRKVTVSRKTISIQEAAKVAPGGDAAQVVKLLPGVQSSGFRPQVVVRGSAPRNSRYYVDDIEVPFIFHSFGNLSVMPGPLLSGVEFEAGGFGAEYGDATGGIITLRTKSEIPETPSTQFIVNVPFYSGVFHERPLDENSSLSVSLRRSYVDAVIRAVLSRRDDAPRGTVISPYFGDAHATYLTKAEGSHTKVSLISGYDGIRAAFQSATASDEDGEVEIASFNGFATLAAERMTRLGKDWRLTTTPQISYQNQSSDFAGNAVAGTNLKLRVPTEAVRRLGKGEDLAIGLDPSVQQQRIKYDAIKFSPDDPTWDPDDAERIEAENTEKFTSVAGWVAVDQVLGDATVTPGVRAFYDDRIEKSSADPRLRAKYKLSEEQTLKSAVGRYSQAPSSRQASKTLGNPELRFEASNHYVLGVESNWGDDWTTDVQVFYKTSIFVPVPDAIEEYLDGGSFRSRGAELFIRRNLTGRLFGWLSYTYSKTEERDDDSESYRDSRYDQTHVLNLVGNYKFSGTFEAGGRYNFHTGDTRSTVAYGVYNANLDKYQPRSEDSDRANARLPNYNALTVYLGKDVLYDSWKLNFRAGVEGFWFKPQVLGVRNNYDYSDTEPVTGLGAIPFLEVKGEL